MTDTTTMRTRSARTTTTGTARRTAAPRKTTTKAGKTATVCRTARPRLAAYDVILLNHSAGKGSQASAAVLMAQARAEGVAGRVVMV